MPWNPNTPGSTSQQDPDNAYSATGPVAQSFLGSASRTTSAAMPGNQALDCLGADSVGIELIVTTVSGTTPSLTVGVEWSNDASNWAPAHPADDFAALTTTARRFKNVAVKGRYMRLTWAISGTTPSFTFAANALLIT